MKKEQIHASCKTWNQTARQAQKDIRPRQRLFPHKIQTVPGGKRGRRARPEVCVLRAQTAKAAVPLAVDRTHRRRRQIERDELQHVYPRPEESWSGTGSQNPRGPGGAGRCCVQEPRRAGEERYRGGVVFQHLAFSIHFSELSFRAGASPRGICCSPVTRQWPK